MTCDPPPWRERAWIIDAIWAASSPLLRPPGRRLRRRARARSSEAFPERGRCRYRLLLPFVSGEKTAFLRRWLAGLRDLGGNRLCRHRRLAHEDLSARARNAADLLRRLSCLELAWAAPECLTRKAHRGASKRSADCPSVCLWRCLRRQPWRVRRSWECSLGQRRDLSLLALVASVSEQPKDDSGESHERSSGSFAHTNGTRRPRI